MNEFNEQKNDISENRDKSQIDDDVKLIRDEILSTESNENNDNNKKLIYNNILSNKTDFSKFSIYDSKSQRSNFDNNIKNNPGPGQYKVKGFAEEIVEKYEKIKSIRKKR